MKKISTATTKKVEKNASQKLTKFDIVAHSIGGKQAIYSPRCDEFLLNNDIQKSIAFGEYSTRLRTLSLVLKNPGMAIIDRSGCTRSIHGRWTAGQGHERFDQSCSIHQG